MKTETVIVDPSAIDVNNCGTYEIDDVLRTRYLNQPFVAIVPTLARYDATIASLVAFGYVVTNSIDKHVPLAHNAVVVAQYSEQMLAQRRKLSIDRVIVVTRVKPSIDMPIVHVKH